MITIRHLSKVFGDNIALKDINAEIQDGEIVSIIGPAGAGKSTLLRCINLMERPTDGQIILNGEVITSLKNKINLIRQKIALVLPSSGLFTHMSVVENVMFAPIQLQKERKADAYLRAMEILSSVTLASKALDYPDELSAGERMRVSIARAIAMNPEVILLDDPTADLDPATSLEVLAVIREAAGNGRSIVIASNDMNLVLSVSDRVFFLDKGQIYESGSPEQIFYDPQIKMTAQFTRSLRIFEAHVTTMDYDFLSLHSRLESFAQNLRMEQKRIRDMHFVIKEVLLDTIIKSLERRFALHLLLMYTPRDESLLIRIRYSGKCFNPFDAMEELPLILLEGVSSFHCHRHIQDGCFSNEVEVRIS